MGPRTTQAELAVDAQRRKLGRMLDDVQDEAKADVHRVEERVTARASAMTDRVTEEAESLPGAQYLLDYAERHPMTAVLAGLGLGVALGMASEGFGDDEDDELAGAKRRRDEARQGRHSSGSSPSALGGLSSMLSGPVLGMVAGPLRDEIGTMLRQTLQGLMGSSGAQSAERDRPADVRRQSMQGAAEARR